jgi:predicted SprT family Zn-dependent metalloprotease
MVIPHTIKVGPHVYSVVRKTGEEMPEALGDTDFDANEIRIRKNMRKTKSQEIVLHELLHACTYPSFTGAYEGEEKLMTEEFVNAVAPVLLQVLKDNPKLVEYLTK